MVVRMRVSGAEQMQVLAKELRAMGLEGRVFRNDLRARIRVAAAPAPAAAKASALAVLPTHGGRKGLNQYVASSRISVSTRLSGGSSVIGVRITGLKGKHDLVKIDEGSVRHRVFGRWVKGVPTQEVTPGWFTKPMEAMAPQMTTAVWGVVTRARLRLERGR